MNRYARRATPRPWFASHSGRRYHSTPYCAAVTAYITLTALTTAQVRARGLTPCQVCRPATLLKIVD